MATITDISIDKRGEDRTDWGFYPVERFICSNENNTGNEPVCDAPHEFASSHCFIR
jgi:hypothetical protein